MAGVGLEKHRGDKEGPHESVPLGLLWPTICLSRQQSARKTFVPPCCREADTVLIPKSGATSPVARWEPPRFHPEKAFLHLRLPPVPAGVFRRRCKRPVLRRIIQLQTSQPATWRN